MWILSEKNSDIFQKFSSFKHHSLLSFRTLKISCCLCNISDNNFAEWQHSFPSFLVVRQAEPRATLLCLTVLLVYSQSVISFQSPVHNQSLFFLAPCYATFSDLLVSLHVILNTLVLLYYRDYTNIALSSPSHYTPVNNFILFSSNPLDYSFHKHGHVWCGEPPSVFVSYSFPRFF